MNAWAISAGRRFAAVVVALLVTASLAPSVAGAAPAGMLYAFGNNAYGELGNDNGLANANPTPTAVTLPGAVGAVTQVAAGGGYSLAVTAGGQLYAFGQNLYGELGDAANTGTDNANPAPTQVTLPGQLGGVTQVAAGGGYSLAVTASGQLYGFGNNDSGELGNATNNGEFVANPTPTLVTLPGEVGPVTQVAAGYDHSLVLTASGQLYAFGYNGDGDLGNPVNDGTDTANPTPTLVTLPGQVGAVTQIAAGGFHSLALTAGGQLYAFGENYYGQLGIATNSGTTNANPTPTLVTLPGQVGAVTQIAAGYDHSLAVTSGGQLYAFGDNHYGQLGNATNTGTDNPNPTPTLVTLPGQVGAVTQIAAGYYHSLAVTASDQLYAFGENYDGELGNATNTGTYNASPTPTPVDFPPGATFATVAEGSNALHTLAIVSGPSAAFATATSDCTTSTVAFPVQSADHSNVTYSLTSYGATGTAGSDASFGAGDTVWGSAGSVSAGSAPTVDISCTGGSVSVQLYDTPNAPATFTGVSSGTSTSSVMPFTASGAGQYVVDATIDEGAVSVSVPGASSPSTIASSGEYPLGSLDAGDHGLRVDGLAGPTAHYSLTVRELPVRISSLSFGTVRYASPGTLLTARFSVSGDTTITAYVRNAAGQAVRHLGSVAVQQGDSSINWDTLGDGDARLPDGSYYLHLDSTDPSGSLSSAETPIVIDGTPPSIAMTSPGTIGRSQSVSFSVSDAESGVAGVSLVIDGRQVEDLGGSSGNPLPPNGQFSFRGPWTSGRHSWQVQATDNVGNERTASGSFAAVDSPAPPPPAHQPAALLACNAGAANSAALASVIPTQLWQRFHRSFRKQDFKATRVLCDNLTGSRAPGMIALYKCCTIAAPTPLGVFEEVGGKWKLVYSLVGRSVYGIKLQGSSLVEESPVYATDAFRCCFRRYRSYRLHWNGRHFVTSTGPVIRG